MTLLLHDVGDPLAGREWGDALPSVNVVRLPGHGVAPAPVGGDYELASAVFAAWSSVGAVPEPIVGVGANGWAAQVLTLGGHASALVLVDGLGGPWLTPEESTIRMRAWVRGLADDPSATDPAPEGEFDPRLRHGVTAHGNRDLAFKAARETTVPVLLIETPASPVSGPDVAELAAAYAGDCQVLRVAGVQEAAAAISDWLANET